MTDEQKATIRRAADWLEANPDKHITRDIARTHGGRRVHPSHPAAECFCAIGRIIKEAGLPASGSGSVGPYTQIHNYIGINESDLTSIWKINDGLTSTNRYGAGNPEVIPFLRAVAA